MDKNPKEMTIDELFLKLKEDGVNSKTASTIRGEKCGFILSKTHHTKIVFSQTQRLTVSYSG